MLCFARFDTISKGTFGHSKQTALLQIHVSKLVIIIILLHVQTAICIWVHDYKFHFKIKAFFNFQRALINRNSRARLSIVHTSPCYPVSLLTSLYLLRQGVIVRGTTTYWANVLFYPSWNRLYQFMYSLTVWLTLSGEFASFHLILFDNRAFYTSNVLTENSYPHTSPKCNDKGCISRRFFHHE